MNQSALDAVPAGFDADAWSRAFTSALQAQHSAYGRISLPFLGRGHQRHLPERTYRLGDREVEAPRETVWLFDGAPTEWLDVAVSYPLEHIDSWMLLLPAERLPAELCATLRPPLVPRMRKTLMGRPWTVVDVTERGEGNLEFTEFMELIGHHPFLKLDHRTDTGLFILESWGERARKERLALNLDEDLYVDILPEVPAPEAPLGLPVGWEAPGDPAAAAAVGDVLDDLYSTLRRLVLDRFQLDTDRLGPLLYWRDWPDELCEFDEREDPAFLDLALEMAERLEADPDEVRVALMQWMEWIQGESSCDVPSLGRVIALDIPRLLGDPEGKVPAVAGGRRWVAGPLHRG